MDRADLPKFYQKNVGLIRTAARRVTARALAIGSGTLDYEEMEQELTEVFIRAFDGYDPSKYRFSTYFMRAAFNHANRIIKKQEIERVANGTQSVEEMGERLDSDDGLSMTVEDVTSIRPEEAAQMQSLMRSWTAQLSELAQAMLSMSLEPPEWLVEEFRAQAGHIEYARELGAVRRSRSEINASYVASTLKTIYPAHALAITDALDEIKTIARNTL